MAGKNKIDGLKVNNKMNKMGLEWRKDPVRNNRPDRVYNPDRVYLELDENEIVENQ